MLLALGKSLARPTGRSQLSDKDFRGEDARWKHVSAISRTAMRVSAFAAALMDLSAQSESLQISPEASFALNRALLSLMELSWEQSSRASIYAARQRRRLVMTTIGLRDQAEDCRSKVPSFWG